MSGIDFFDVDHTLTRRSSGGRFVALAMRKKVAPRRLLFVLPWYALTYRLGVFRLRAYDDGFPYLRGIQRETLEGLARESFANALKDDLFPGGVSLVRRLRAEGRRVMLATSSLDFIVAPVAEHLGVDGVLATALEFKDGVCTGRLGGVPMFRREKKDRVLAYLADQGVPASECSFYSDSIYDLPLLESVGRPVAANPDWRLRRIARRRGWPIMDLSEARPGRSAQGVHR
ncbi:MAG: HAD family hydrolase [Spirochaetia bacterium]|jgi:HAD superfamily hydrolase (TIGR01490 family)